MVTETEIKKSLARTFVHQLVPGVWAITVFTLAILAL
jgi:hypothetical protein